MRAQLANLNNCAVLFLNRAAVNLCWYNYTHDHISIAGTAAPESQQLLRESYLSYGIKQLLRESYLSYGIKQLLRESYLSYGIKQ